MEAEKSRSSDPRTYAIIGAAMEVHRRLGPGFLEAVYQEALAIELPHHGVPFEREVEIPIVYRDIQLACAYRADFVCFRDVIIELKALRQLTDIETGTDDQLPQGDRDEAGATAQLRCPQPTARTLLQLSHQDRVLSALTVRDLNL